MLVRDRFILTFSLPPSAPIGIVIPMCVLLCSSKKLFSSGFTMTWPSTPITMFFDKKVDSWSTNVGITLGTVHVSVVSVKLVPSVELDRQSHKAPRQLESPVSSPCNGCLSLTPFHHRTSTAFTNETLCSLLTNWWLFCHRNPDTQSSLESPVSDE